MLPTLLYGRWNLCIWTTQYINLSQSHKWRTAHNSWAWLRWTVESFRNIFVVKHCPFFPIPGIIHLDRFAKSARFQPYKQQARYILQAGLPAILIWFSNSQADMTNVVQSRRRIVSSIHSKACEIICDLKPVEGWSAYGHVCVMDNFPFYCYTSHGSLPSCVLLYNIDRLACRHGNWHVLLDIHC